MVMDLMEHKGRQVVCVSFFCSLHMSHTFVMRNLTDTVKSCILLPANVKIQEFPMTNYLLHEGRTLIAVFKPINPSARSRFQDESLFLNNMSV